MSSIKKMLVLVEGKKTEPKLFNKLLRIYELDIRYSIVIYNTNIHVLYKDMFIEGNGGIEEPDILMLLRSKEKDEEKKKIFNEKYTDILLIFDFDPHDNLFVPEHIREMQQYFNESTESGKLYINYPMCEAFYHMTAIPDEDFLNRTVSIDELKTYKSRVNRESKGHDYKKFVQNRNECSAVILHNIVKACLIITGEKIACNKVCDIKPHIELSTLLDKQLRILNSDKFFFVLCACVFYIYDYNPELLR